MTHSSSRSWDDVVDALRSAAAEVRSAIGRTGPPTADEDAAATRLKGDVSRLEQSASDLLAKLSGELDQQRSELGSSFDRERAERSADQIKGSLEELASLARGLTSDVASAAGTSLKQAEPELKTAVRALEDVAGSAVSWIRATIDPPTAQRQDAPTEGKPPLDDL